VPTSLQPEELFDLPEGARCEEHCCRDDGGEHDPETETCVLSLAVSPLTRGATRAVEAVRALDCVRIERRIVVERRPCLELGHERSVGTLRTAGRLLRPQAAVAKAGSANGGLRPTAA
jgi:hypothetical protein